LQPNGANKRLAIRPEKQQIASALIREIDIIVSDLNRNSLRSSIENALLALETKTEKVEIDGVRRNAEKLCDRSPVEFILLPSSISKGLMRFYAIARETESDLEWYSRALEAYDNQRVRLMNHGQMIRLLRKVLDKIELLSRLRPTLIEKLKEIQDTDCG
jgi:hypothetical protein